MILTGPSLLEVKFCEKINLVVKLICSLTQANMKALLT